MGMNLMMGQTECTCLWVNRRENDHRNELIMNILTYPSMELMGGRMGGRGMMGGKSTSLPQSSRYPVFKIQISGTGSIDLHLPDQLADDTPLSPSAAHNQHNPRTFKIGRASCRERV